MCYEKVTFKRRKIIKLTIVLICDSYACTQYDRTHKMIHNKAPRTFNSIIDTSNNHEVQHYVFDAFDV